MRSRVLRWMPVVSLAVLGSSVGAVGRVWADTRYDFDPGWRLFVGDAKGAEPPPAKRLQQHWHKP